MGLISWLLSVCPINRTQFHTRRYTQPQKDISALHAFFVYFVIIGMGFGAQNMYYFVQLCTLLHRHGGAP